MDKRFSLAIAAIIRNEAAYLAEWIEYHSLIGFEHFYLYDNGSTDETTDVLRDYIVQGRVTLLLWPEFPGQTSAYNHAIKVFGRDSEWMALIDPDEFVQIEAGRSLRDVLADLGAVDQVLLPWMHFDSSGHEERPEGLVIESYTRRAETAHRQPKSLVRPEAVRWAEVHHCITRQGRTVDPAGRPLPERWILDHPPEGPIRLNHYFTKSRADFAAKIARGQADGGRGKTMEAFGRFACPVEDSSLAAMGPLVRRAIGETAARSKHPAVHAAWSAQSELSASRIWTLRVQAALKKLRSHVGVDAVGRSDIEWEQLILRSGVPRGIEPVLAEFREDFAERICHDFALDGWQPANLPYLGRPYLALACSCAEDTQLQTIVQGEDAGGKPFEAQSSLPLPAGDSVTFAILCERTMIADRVLLRPATPVTVAHVEICSFR